MKSNKILFGIIITICFIVNSYATTYKGLPINLPQGTVPNGKFENEKIFIDIEQDEILETDSFKEQIEDKSQEGLHAIFALVITKDGKGKPVYNFYSASPLNKLLFGDPPFSKNRSRLKASQFTDPSNRQTITGKIYYFIIDGVDKPFKFLGTDSDIWGVKANFIKKFFAADEGNPQAQFFVARFYEWGQGVPKDLQKAMNFYKKAAKGGSNNAKVALKALEKKMKS